MKIQIEINEIQNREIMKKITKTKRLFFEKINKINKYLARLTKKRLRLLKLEGKEKILL